MTSGAGHAERHDAAGSVTLRSAKRRRPKVHRSGRWITSECPATPRPVCPLADLSTRFSIVREKRLRGLMVATDSLSVAGSSASTLINNPDVASR